MFDFKNIKFDKRDGASKNSFVGIRRNRDGELEFRLPIGFENFPEDNYNLVKKLFFQMYRTFRKFEERISKNIEPDKRSAGKDQIERIGDAYRFSDKDDEPVILYSKIRFIESVLEIYNELALNHIQKISIDSNRIDYNKIDRYLHIAVYQDEVAYIQEMQTPQNIVTYDSNDLMELFCFILNELHIELEQVTDTRIQTLSTKFREKHLHHDQSLFNKDTFSETIQILKDTLSMIDRKTAYKGDDYWQLFDVVENFLYGELDINTPREDGIYWGISRFDCIWEDMCYTYAFRHFFDEIIYADTNTTISEKPVSNTAIGGQKLFVRKGFSNPFSIGFRNEKRWMRPDLVRQISAVDKIKIQKIKEHHTNTIDFKINVAGSKKPDIAQKLVSDLQSSLKRMKGARVVNSDGYSTFLNYNAQRYNAIIDKCNLLHNLIIVFDWKYHDQHDYKITKTNEKIDLDIIKQLTYEFALSCSFKSVRIKSRFFIPYFYPENTFPPEGDIGELIEQASLIPKMSEAQIEVFKTSFLDIQKEYLLEP